MRRISLLAGLPLLALALACSPGASRAAAPEEGPRTELTVDLAPDGRVTAVGVLPEGMSPEEFEALLPGAEISGIEPDEAGPPGEWARALEALSIVLPRFHTATARLAEETLAIEGKLKRGLSALGVEAALRAALGTGWRLELDLAESAPLPEIVLHVSEDGLAVSGLLPSGLAPSEALTLLGEQAGDAGLAGGGDGDPKGWSRTLAALGELLDLFTAATASVSEGEAVVTGALRPGYARDAVASRLGARLPEGWEARLDVRETTPGEGDRRVNLDTGEPESFRSGHWLPDVDFPVALDNCRSEADAILGSDELDFVEGTAEIHEHGLPVVNRLAAIAIRCLNSSAIRLEIGAHTDSVGNDRENEELSRARAETLRQALLDRGVRAEAVTALGYGERRPIATNDTPEGREKNRRITFEWAAPEG